MSVRRIFLALALGALGASSRAAFIAAPGTYGGALVSAGAVSASGAISPAFAGMLNLGQSDPRQSVALANLIASRPLAAAPASVPALAVMVRAELAAAWTQTAPARAQALAAPGTEKLAALAPQLADFLEVAPALPEPAQVDGYFHQIMQRKGESAVRLVEHEVDAWNHALAEAPGDAPAVDPSAAGGTRTRAAARLLPAGPREAPRRETVPEITQGPSADYGPPRLSSLSNKELNLLVDRLGHTEIREPRALPFPADTTFSLELEFLVNRQLTRQDMNKLFPGRGLLGGRELSPAQWREWEARRNLPPDAWARARSFAVKKIMTAAPRGWRVSNESAENRGGNGNTQELQTANSGRVYHENTPKDWDALAAGLASINDVMPGGIYSAHVHIGRKSLTDDVDGGKKLKVDPRRFAVLSLVFENYWRGLMGSSFGFAPEGTAVPLTLLDPRRESDSRTALYVQSHGNSFNLSDLHPTVENKLATRLLSAAPGGGEWLDPARLRTQLWPAFAFFDLAARTDDLPLASLGDPALAGETPRWRQLAHFLDLVYGDDSIGKAVALKKMVSLPQGPPVNEETTARRRAEVDEIYADMGLTSVLELHRAHGGYDEKLVAHLMENDGALMHRLALDMKRAGFKPAQAAQLLPQEARAALRAAMGEAPRRAPVPAENWLLRLRRWFFSEPPDSPAYAS